MKLASAAVLALMSQCKVCLVRVRRINISFVESYQDYKQRLDSYPECHYPGDEDYCQLISHGIHYALDCCPRKKGKVINNVESFLPPNL